MSLTPQTVKLLDSIAKARTIHVTEIPLEKIRELALTTARALGGIPKTINKTEQIEIDGPSGKIALRIYTPNLSSDLEGSPTPALIYFFGGGFVWGSIDTHDIICRDLTHTTNCKVISVNYKLAPEYKYPVAVNEAFTATKSVFTNAKQLNIDSKKIAISGYSAGGNLAALTALKARDEGLQLAYQILFCPWLDLSCSFPSYKKYAQDYYVLDQKTIDFFVNHYLPNEISTTDPKVSPIWENNLRGLPPTLIVSAEFDPLADENKQYSENLKAAGVKASNICYSGQIHAFISYRGVLELEKDPLDEVGSILKDFFKKK